MVWKPIIIVCVLFTASCDRKAAGEERTAAILEAQSEEPNVNFDDTIQQTSAIDPRSNVATSTIPPDTATTGFQPPPPVLPEAFDEASYPDCSSSWRGENLISDKVASLRECVRALESFRKHHLERFGIILRTYQQNLLRYEAEQRRLNNPRYIEILSYFRAELEKLDPRTGSYRLPYREYFERYSGDLRQSLSQICRLRQIDQNNGC